MASSLGRFRDGPIEMTEMPDRTDELPLIKQGPVTRITVWQKILDDIEVDGDEEFQGHYFEDAGLLLIDLGSGCNDDF